MSRARHSLAMQVASLRHIMPAVRNDPTLSPDTVDALSDLLVTVADLEKHQTFMRAARKLQQKHPEIAAVMAAFPDAEIVDFRVRDEFSEAAE